MEIFNGTSVYPRGRRTNSRPALLLTIFVYSQAGGYPHAPGEHQRDRHDTRQMRRVQPLERMPKYVPYVISRDKIVRGERNDLGKRALQDTLYMHLPFFE